MIEPAAECGNGNRDDGEQCDGTADPTGCDEGFECNATCTDCEAVNTPPSTDPVTVTEETTVTNPITGEEIPLTVQVTYASVDEGGNTTVEPLSELPAGEFPDDIELVVDDFVAAFFDISTGATVRPPIDVCATYPDDTNDGIVDGTESASECDVRILHEENAFFVPRTLGADDPSCQLPMGAENLCPGAPEFGGSPPCIDRVANVVCGQVQNLSPFTVALTVEQEICDDGSDNDGDGDIDCDDPDCAGDPLCVVDGKVTICHKGKNITVSRSALNAHLDNHGDLPEACP